MTILPILFCALMDSMSGATDKPTSDVTAVLAPEPPAAEAPAASRAADPDVGPWDPSAARHVKEERIKAPVIESLEQMQERFAQIPKEQRKEEMLKARQRLREGLVNGVRGAAVNAMLLTLDMMLTDTISLDRDARAILLIDPNDPAANAAIGRLRLMSGHADAAEPFLAKGVKGGGPMAMCDYARVLVGKGEFAEAETWARKAVEKRPGDPTMYEPLVAALAETRQFDAADKAIKAMLDVTKAAQRENTVKFAAQVMKRMESLKAGE